MYKASSREKYKPNPPKSSMAVSTTDQSSAAPEIDQIIVDKTRRPHKKYLRGKFLGKVFSSNTVNFCLLPSQLKLTALSLKKVDINGRFFY